jgi:poly(3-hydroxybutyrate) depolymerase
MTVEGELDDISGPGQTRAAHGLCSNLAPEKHTHLFVPGVGHYGIFNGSRWRRAIQPEVARFIRAHDPATRADA